MITHRLRREPLSEKQDRVVCDTCGYERAINLNPDGSWRLGEKIRPGDVTVSHAYTDSPGMNFLTVGIR